MDLLGIAIYTFLGLLIVGLVYAMWLLIDTLPLKPIGRKKQRKNSNVLTHWERQLLAMVGGDRGIATRLLLNVRFRNPHKSKTWCYEKVIYDLKRDRRAI